VFFISGRTAESIGTKLGTRIHLDSGSVLVKSRLRSRLQRRRRENGGAVGAESDR